jgi:uncharacterized RDD family membrane protein YckC
MPMHRALASLTDVAAVAVLSFGAFRLAVALVACKNPAECPLLAPATVLLIVVLVGAYFVVAYLRWGRSPGRRLFDRGDAGTPEHR